KGGSAVVLVIGVLVQCALGQSVTEFSLPNDSRPLGVTLGPDQKIWFTEYTANRIASISAAGEVEEFDVPTPGSRPLGITLGPDANLWFIEFAGSKVGRLTVDRSGQAARGPGITEYALPDTDSQPFFIAVGADQNLWFTEFATNRIGRITTSGSI